MGGGPSKEDIEKAAKRRPSVDKAQFEIRELQLRNVESARLVRNLSNENYELKQKLNEVKQQMDKLTEVVAREEKEMEKVAYFLKGKNIKIKYNGKFALVGPKGSGKSTFLWIHNRGPKPSRKLEDGTKQLIYEKTDFVDTIGIPITIEHVLRLVALFLVTEVPESIYLFGNDRVDDPSFVLNHLGVRKCYFVSLDLKYIFKNYKEDYYPVGDFEKDDNCYDIDLYESLRECDHMFKPIKAGRAPMKLFSFNDLLGRLFPKNVVELVDIGEDSLSVIRKRLCFLVYRFFEVYDQNQLRFINEMI